MSRTQRDISIAIVIMMLILLYFQFNDYQTQVERHENAIKFWTEEVPKVQEEYPEFSPKDAEEALAREEALYARQVQTIAIKSGLIVLVSGLAIAAVYYLPRRNIR
ncbi:hypothetical protein SYNTR_1886 [Candidatus Syntrophocurvum alkaliphilum]|uniref:Uncharacterized protein n=1 Tax=Candidatus Syntrophocurvum alkaliphilum TaxID=2293317 RepID=A0A6I6DKK7_9FIRM|nr:hypothetical protein [Candidatus Syntrophocurvum alkaliphilum]QGU00480.1 hypothetical protein SYNTR_1886 [Candidatus Syntrophocurvum alkaliphilum]